MIRPVRTPLDRVSDGILPLRMGTLEMGTDCERRPTSRGHFEMTAERHTDPRGSEPAPRRRGLTPVALRGRGTLERDLGVRC